jgi:hypothetical protein
MTDEKSITGETGQFTRTALGEDDAMKRSWLSKLSLTASVLAILAIGTVRAEEVGQVVVIREAGQPDHRCLIERATLQANGTKVYDVRDLDSGERMRVLDKRTAKPAARPVVQATAKQAVVQAAAEQIVPTDSGARKTVANDSGMIAALGGSPFALKTDGNRVTPLAEQAAEKSKSGVVRAGLFRFLDK